MTADDWNLRDLQHKLERAEAVIQALRGHQVDAVIGDDHISYVRLRETEEELRRSEQRYRAIVEDQAELICRWTPDGTLTFTNQAFRRYYVGDREELPGMHILDFVHPEDRTRVKTILDSLCKENPLSTREHRCLRPGGEVRWQQWTDRAILDQGGNIEEIQSVGRDVTERREAVDELERLKDCLEQKVVERTDQLRRLTRQLARTEQEERRRLAQLLHDHLQQLLVQARLLLGTLPSTMKGDGLTLSESPAHTEEEPSGSPPDALQETVEKIDQVLGETIKASRSLAVELSPPVLYRAVFPEALQWLCEKMKDYGLSVTFQQEGEAELESEELRAFLFHSVRELLLNVVKHAGTVRARLLVTALPGSIRVTVEDHGSGFDSRILDRVDAGYGLFSISERLLLHGGSMEVESSPGKGCKILLTIPRT